MGEKWQRAGVEGTKRNKMKLVGYTSRRTEAKQTLQWTVTARLQRKAATKEFMEKGFRGRNVFGGLQVPLEEDGGSISRQSWGFRISPSHPFLVFESQDAFDTVTVIHAYSEKLHPWTCLQTSFVRIGSFLSSMVVLRDVIFVTSFCRFCAERVQIRQFIRV